MLGVGGRGQHWDLEVGTVPDHTRAGQEDILTRQGDIQAQLGDMARLGDIQVGQVDIRAELADIQDTVAAWDTRLELEEIKETLSLHVFPYTYER
jgi:hypothetical protein